MDYDSIKDGAYNSNLYSDYQNDLQDIEPKAYQKSELPAKEKISVKAKIIKRKSEVALKVDGGKYIKLQKN